MEWHVHLFVLMAIKYCTGYKIYQDRLPNGNMVTHPCKPTQTWKGAGHVNPGGGGIRNAFGMDFQANDKIWDTCLCNYDSDGDGRTNGEELGDPDCVWTEGQSPERTTNLGHPGVCEPINSTLCMARNEYLGDFCNKGDKSNTCLENIKNQAGVLSQRISFPETPVPSLETTYMCQVFTLPNDTDYHIIASEPYTVNEQVTHHILIRGCRADVALSDKPFECGMTMSVCDAIIMAWTVGTNGVCLNEAFGIRIGLTGYQKAVMEIHWNNPELRGDYTDSSGIIMYYTPNLRKKDGATMTAGQAYIGIPPGKADYRTFGMCHSGCTSIFPHNIYITDAMIHMHYLGSKGYIEHYRNDCKVTDLVSEDDYKYDSPTFFRYDPPLEFRPWDSMKIICHYNSINRAAMTYYGESTSDEMCFGLFSYYPKIDILQGCFSNINAPFCPHAREEDFLVGECNYTSYAVHEDAFYAELADACDHSGESCFSSCQNVLLAWSAKEPCLVGEALEFTKTRIRVNNPEENDPIINQMESCDENNSNRNQQDFQTTDDRALLCDKESGSSGSDRAVLGLAVFNALVCTAFALTALRTS